MYFCYQDNLNIARKGLETIEYCLQEKLSSAMQGKMKVLDEYFTSKKRRSYSYCLVAIGR